MIGRLQDKVALVTGGNSGIGKAAALVFAREGAKVVVANNRDVKGGEETAQTIKKAGGQSIFVKTDVSKATEVETLINNVVDTYGRLDCAFNNAGVSIHTQNTTVDWTEKDWDWIININLKGVWLCMKYEIPQMLKQGSGAIVNTSSIGGLIGLPYYSPYTASKHGVCGLTKVAALEYAKAGIRVNAVCPAIIRTPTNEPLVGSEILARDLPLKQPLGRLGKPEEVAEAVVWLCSDAASFVTGHSMTVDAGWTAQ